MANRRPADWRFPNEKQARAEETARRMKAAAPEVTFNTVESHSPTPGPADPMPDSYWDALLADPRAGAGAPRTSLAQQRLADIKQHLLRVSCRRCDRIVEIQTADAVRLFGGAVTWKDAGLKILDANCNARTGNRDDDGCWPDYQTR
jgi:hypothetical protein